ncbi:hypothetical protein ACFSTH_11400 [Paenibacillus yanchengensis]|uniref:Uncharacterized protein n=1 Tax=Paenibacillus yanchengensis TaxID=2035833 RepID=A0ABW4YJK6_9BACL
MQFKDKIPDSIVNRKGARTASEILPDVIGILNSGRIESVNLTEWLVVDHLKLLRHVLIEFELLQHANAMLSELEQIGSQSMMKVIPLNCW